MRHRKGYKTLGKAPAHRRAMLRNMATSLILHEGIQTTLGKAKAIRPIVEKLITKGKKGDLHAIRELNKYLFDKKATFKVINDLGKQYAQRPGGYLRIRKLGRRFRDGAAIARIEFVDREEKTTES